MNTNITFRHMQPSDALRRYAEEKTERVKKYLNDPIDVHWVLMIEKIRQIATVTVNANSVTIKAEEKTNDLYSAIDKVIDKVEKQVKKFKEKLKDHRVANSAALMSEVNASKTEDLSLPARVIRRENMFIKPMTLDEALMQIDLLDNNFLIFKDATSSNTNLLYKRKDGNYGLIEAR